MDNITENSNAIDRGKVFVHIGLPKTASTTIQNSLAENRLILNERGYYIPHKWSKYKAFLPLNNISYQICDHPRYKPEMGGIDDIVQELLNIHDKNIILSAEHFSSLNIAGIRKLKEFFERFGDIVIVAYIRRQDLWLKSWWSQLVKNGYMEKEFEEFADLVINDLPPISPGGNRNQFQRNIRPDYQTILEPFETVFGTDQIRLRILERNQLKGNVFQDFLETINLRSLDDLVFINVANITPSEKTLEVMRYLVSIVGLETLGPKKKLVGRIMKNIKEYAEENGWNNDLNRSMDREISEMILARYADSNRNLAINYFSRDQLFLEPISEQSGSDFSISDMSAEEVMKLTGFLLKQIKRFDEKRKPE